MSEKTATYSTVHAPLGDPAGPGLWHHKGMQLPAYIQNVAQGLLERGMDRSRAIETAIGVVRNWAEGKGKVHPEVRAAAAKAVAEFEALRAKAHATKTAHSPTASLALAAFNPSAHPRAAAGGATGGQFVPLGQANSASSAQAQADPASQHGYRTAMTDKTADRNKFIKGLSNSDLGKLSRIAYSSTTSDPHIVALRIAIAKELAHRGIDVRQFGAKGTDLKIAKPKKPGAKPRAVKPPKPGAKPRQPAPVPGSTHLAQETTVDRLALAGTAGTVVFTPMTDSQSGSKVTVNDTSKATGSGNTGTKLDAASRRKAAVDGASLPDGSYPIYNTQDVRNAVQAAGRAPAGKQPKVRAHIIRRAKKIGAMRHVPTHWTTASAVAASHLRETDMASCPNCAAPLALAMPPALAKALAKKKAGDTTGQGTPPGSSGGTAPTHAGAAMKAAGNAGAGEDPVKKAAEALIAKGWQPFKAYAAARKIVAKQKSTSGAKAS